MPCLYRDSRNTTRGEVGRTRHRLGRSTAKCCTPDGTWLLYTWTHSSCGYLRQTKLLENFSMVVNRAPETPSLAQELLITEGCDRWQSHFSLRGDKWKIAYAWVDNPTAMHIWCGYHWLDSVPYRSKDRNWWWKEDKLEKRSGVVGRRELGVDMIKMYLMHW